jgi:hypothetical protein
VSFIDGSTSDKAKKKRKEKGKKKTLKSYSREEANNRTSLEPKDNQELYSMIINDIDDDLWEEEDIDPELKVTKFVLLVTKII